MQFHRVFTQNNQETGSKSRADAVSYTHLDVYKRQPAGSRGPRPSSVPERTYAPRDAETAAPVAPKRTCLLYTSTAVGQLAGHPAGLQRALAAHQLPGLFGGGAGAGCLGGLFKNGLCHAGVLLLSLIHIL